MEFKFRYLSHALVNEKTMSTYLLLPHTFALGGNQKFILVVRDRVHGINFHELYFHVIKKDVLRFNHCGAFP
jgi:hypothetical protein